VNAVTVETPNFNPILTPIQTLRWKLMLRVTQKRNRSLSV